ncbi:membrane protein [Dokdonia pacifica]|uniref:OmpA family protein n=1 Tax=Dokdonia pacifica TaxID=1627892 RepID=UPI0015C58D4D|nr:OmpA family protein [Dokdonia pacifica]GGG41269.1 membrane protein [Dokdonia pacifica]
MLAQTEHKVRLYYENDMYELTDTHYKKIDSIKQVIAVSDSVMIRIEGYANAYGTDRYNLNLSKKRAMKVASLFDEETIVKTQGFGELESTSAQNRRVDIIFSYIDVVEEVSTKEVTKDVTINDLSALEVGDKAVLKGILFVGGTDRILPESTVALQELHTYLNTHKNIRIHLIGHICCHGETPSSDDGLNNITNTFTLSKDRAKAIYDYLIQRGISNDRLTYEGRAYLEPLGKGSKYDRRVEIEILE